MDQLSAYIVRQLGGGVWDIEITKQHCLDAIQDALGLYSQWRPDVRVGAVTMASNLNRYLVGVDMGFGVVQVDFVDPFPTVAEVFYGNLISPAPMMSTGLDEYDSFQRWRKTWQRVTSVMPNWYYDEDELVLLIHNPIERYHAGIWAHFPWENTTKLPRFGAQWVKEYSLEKARYTYGEILAKYSGAIPGPLKDLQLDSAKRQNAEARITRLEEKLFNSQVSTPVSVD